MKNRRAWGMILALSGGLLVAAWVLIGWGLRSYFDLSPGPCGAGVQVAGRWHIGYQMAELREGRILSIGPIEVYMGPLMDQ